MPIAGGRFPSSQEYSNTTLDEPFMMMPSKESHRRLHDTYRIAGSRESKNEAKIAWLAASALYGSKYVLVSAESPASHVMKSTLMRLRAMIRTIASEWGEKKGQGRMRVGHLGDIILYLEVIEVLRNPRVNASLFVHDIM